MKLAAALLRRKELQGKVDQLKQIKDRDLFEVIVKRQPVSESVDDIQAQVPRLNASQVTAEFDFYARQLRLIDGAIQHTNWTADLESIDGSTDVMADYVAPTKEDT